ncbi:sigma factor [soil metagenome]
MLPGAQNDERFPATRWSRVVAAGDPSSPDARAALDDICRDYWFPLYVYVRRWGRSPEDAEDLTQGFFARILERGFLADADRSKGKLRTFLLTALKHYLTDEHHKANTLKRGGGKIPLSIDAALAEELYALEPKDEASPDRLYEKRWALTLLDNVLAALRADYARAGKAELFDTLQPALAWNAGGDRYSDLAAALGMKENAVRVAIFRLRRRYGDLLRQQVAETVASPDEVAAELDNLMTVLRT